MTNTKNKGAYQDIIASLKKFTNHSSVRLTNCGNSAIFAALCIAKQLGRDTIIIPDQAGWISYKTYPKILGLNIEEVKTDDGIINLEALKKLADKKTAVIVPSFAGYFAEQPMKKIAEVCKKQNTLLIEDASSAIGDKTLCDGRISDIIIASFGKAKPVDLGYGGFISTNDRENLEKIRDVFSFIEFEESFQEKLLEKLNGVEARLKKLFAQHDKIVKELEKYKGFDVVHRQSRGINVVVRFKTDEEKNEIISYCEKNKLEYTMCPRYIRLEDKAVSIEVKRLTF